jgi:transposase
MAPRLSKSQRNKLQDVITANLEGKEAIDDNVIAAIINCSTRTVRKARSNILQHGTIDVPGGAPGRPREVTENMWLALKGELEQNPCMSQQHMADYLYKQFGADVSRFNIGRTLKRFGWKVTQNIAKERRQDLRDDYMERRCDKRFTLTTIG